MKMTGLDRTSRARVGELASSPLDVAAAAEIRSVIVASRRATSSKSGGTSRSRSRRTTRKDTT